MSVLLSLAGLLLLVAGAESLVRGASRLAAAFGISPLVVGLTVVAYGTSAPEMAVSVIAGLAGRADVTVGNVVGSNVFNILFILGLSALIAPLVVTRTLVRREVPLMVAVSALPLLMGLDGGIGRLDGLLLFGGALAFTGILIYTGKRGKAAATAERPEPELPGSRNRRRLLLDTGLVLLGLALLALGSRLLVDGVTIIARGLGVSELVIGLTVVAAGTSMPEVATSVIASARGERDIAVGNVVGSNVFNVLAVLGLAGLVTPGGVTLSEAVLRFDLLVMIGAAIACLPIFFTGHRISRWEGGLFLAYYVAYVAYLVLTATRHEALALFSLAMAGFVIPLTVVTLAVFLVRSWRRQPGQDDSPDPT